jgi:hypothetical protein
VENGAGFSLAGPYEEVNAHGNRAQFSTYLLFAIYKYTGFPAGSLFCLSPAYLLVLPEIISSTLKMEAICSSERSVETQRTTRRHIPEDDTLHILRTLNEDLNRF